MNRSAAVLLLTLVLGACVAASADGDKRNNYEYEHEPKDYECHLAKPWRYKTHECPTCQSNAGCIETKCSDSYEGKADVKINLKCLFGGKIGFVAVSYWDGYKHVCVNNQNGHKYDKFIKLYNLKCKELPKLRFIVQNKWWYNPYGKDLKISDSCYDKCTKGKPCHTCIFKDIHIPHCKKYCKKDKCDTYHKKECPHDDHCFEYKKEYDYVKVTLKEECREKYSYIAVSYDDYHYGDKSIDYKSSDDHDLSFKAECKSKFKWFFEDYKYYNKYAPKYPSYGDKCYDYFKHGKACNQCGPYKGHVPECKEPHHDEHKKDDDHKKEKKDD
jgi:hypothetical protein